MNTIKNQLQFKMKVISTNIGVRKKVDWKGTLLETGIFKQPVASIYLDKEDVQKDAVIDRRYHGGIDKAVYAYSVDHYPYWKELYPALEWDFGMFGENLSVEGLEESKLHIGDSFKVGAAIIEVTGPREPCVKLGMRFKDVKVIKQFWKQTKSGVYFKVRQAGEVKAGDVLEPLQSKKENKTIAEEYLARK